MCDDYDDDDDDDDEEQLLFKAICQLYKLLIRCLYETKRSDKQPSHTVSLDNTLSVEKVQLTFAT